jgi:CheY-like chemotaxis protein
MLVPERFRGAHPGFRQSFFREPRVRSMGAGRDLRVTVFAQPSAALERLRTTPEEFDLVMTDYSMPVVNGLDVAREVLGLGRRIPLILLTGFIDDLPAEKLAEVGIARVARKPLTMQDLAEITQQALSDGPALEAARRTASGTDAPGEDSSDAGSRR